ncbi:CRISPR-associated endoribonuclease Cas6 [Acetobacterium tundrae]|uniref:CRISPR-associated endoribonuclease Cas6 n=1 Tax=Acetobacterium tundrae TaxID=132932 RepID=A0ABR6WP80_9FIRM|nr:CRISPR-associated endoribonuclease Cas6 [Acetobacterium tundrae]MBC3798256.1 CRISPR-associated endoribonuclease Cas6 [Acetobacterium tundrae]
MKIFSYSVKVYVLKDIHYTALMQKLCDLIDSCFDDNPDRLNWHSANQFKNYSFSGLTPLEKNKNYCEGKIYSFSLRTTDEKLGLFFNNRLENAYSSNLKVLTIESKVLPHVQLSKIYSITPVVLKTEGGYWRTALTFEDFERRLKENLIKKYNAMSHTKMNENFQLFNHIKFDNQKPISTAYKDINLLGDKLTLMLENNPSAQELAYVAIGSGIGEMGSRGFGFCNYKFI